MTLSKWSAATIVVAVAIVIGLALMNLLSSNQTRVNPRLEPLSRSGEAARVECPLCSDPDGHARYNAPRHNPNISAGASDGKIIATGLPRHLVREHGGDIRVELSESS